MKTLPITHSVLDAKALGERIKDHYGLAEPFRCELLTRGMNDVYLVRAAGKKFAARAWRANWRSEANVTYELSFLLHLKEAGVDVVIPVRVPDGSLHFSVEAPEGQRFVALFQWADGVPYGEDPDAETARRLGGMIAAVHKAGTSFAPAERRHVATIEVLKRELPRVLGMVAHRPEDTDYYPKAVDAVTHALAGIDRAAAPFGPSHGDFHLYNAFRSAGGRLVLLDFDNCGEDHFAPELMSFAWANHYVGVGEEVSRAFLEGYNAERPMSESEVALLPVFFAAKELRFLFGFAANVNCVGHTPLLNPDLDWFAENIRRHMSEAKLM
ncbi:MAG: phosphotransferase [Proteobacteria bacterium]|nr:phosphotransferase [Pseudomonadota bacterium]